MILFDPITGDAVPPYQGWRPYCLNCDTIVRMSPTARGWRCATCLNEIDRRLQRISAEVIPIRQLGDGLERPSDTPPAAENSDT